MTSELSTRTFTLAIALLALAALAGCGRNDGAKTDKEIRLTESDDGRTIVLKKDQLMSLTLVDPVLPWRWEVGLSQPGIIEQDLAEETRRAEAERPADPIPGARHNSTLVFKAIATGEVTLTLVSRRPDRKDEEVREGVKIQVEVK